MAEYRGVLNYGEQEALVDELLSNRLRLNGGFVDFRGDEYCADECMGWDGNDRRCDCGNRRVIATLYGDDTDYYIVCEAW